MVQIAWLQCPDCDGKFYVEKPQLCKNADAVKNDDSGNVPRLLGEIDKANESIGKLRQEAEREARRAKDEARKAAAIYNETKSIPAEIDDLKVEISGLQSRLGRSGNLGYFRSHPGLRSVDLLHERGSEG